MLTSAPNDLVMILDLKMSNLPEQKIVVVVWAVLIKVITIHNLCLVAAVLKAVIILHITHQFSFILLVVYLRMRYLQVLSFFSLILMLCLTFQAA
jgi:hypothetical protein